jgi:hypothetical protein
VAKKYGVPRTTLQYWLHKDFPPLGLQNKGRFKRVLTPDLEDQLREHAVTLQKMFYGVTGMEMRKLAEITEGQIFNIDKTGVSTIQTPTKMVEQRGMKQVGRITSADWEKNIIGVGTVSATGTFIAPISSIPGLG